MGGLGSGRALVCLLTGGLAFHFLRTNLAFSTAQLKTSSPTHAAPLLRGSPALEARANQAHRGGASSADRSLLLSLCGAAAASVAAGRVLRVGMRGQGQGGRANFGQSYMPQLKGTKKLAVLRKKKNYGSAGARQVPRRYKLYDILEELDEKVPWYTVVSEPKEPLEPIWDVPLVDRYPWAGSLEKVPEEKKELEEEDPMEPLFGSITGTQLPPKGRRQRYIHRRGWPEASGKKYPPWLNRPLIGTEVIVPDNTPFEKDRRPEALKKKHGEIAQKYLKDKYGDKYGDKADLDDVDFDEDDDMDAELKAMEADAD